MHVRDGGHYDNLGLVEALRRGASNIVVLDASGDRPNTWSTLARATERARADAGVEIALDPTMMTSPLAPGQVSLAPGQVTRPWAYGRFHRLPGARAQDNAEVPEVGGIWVCKLGWWYGAPLDVLAYARSHTTYPHDGALVPLYDSAEFNAYQQLGAAAAQAAVREGAPPLRGTSRP